MKEIRDAIINHLVEFIRSAESKDVIKNAYRIYNLLNAVKTLKELERIEIEQDYEKIKNLVIIELINKYPSIGEILKLEISNGSELPL